MKVRTSYFASLKERLGRSGDELVLDASEPTVAEVRAALFLRDPASKAAFEEVGRIRVAVNHDIADFDTPVADGDEVAFFPPVTGG